MRDGYYDELMEEAQEWGLSPRQVWRAIAGAHGSFAAARCAVERLAEDALRFDPVRVPTFNVDTLPGRKSGEVLFSLDIFKEIV